MYSKFMKRIFAFLTIFLVVTNFSYAYSQDLSLGIYPPIVKIRAKKGSQVKIPLKIENFSENKVNLSASYKEFKSTNSYDGNIEYLPKSKKFKDLIYQNIKISINNTQQEQIFLDAKEMKYIDLSILIPSNQEPADYYFSLILKTTSSSTPISSASKINLGVSSNILLSIEPDYSSSIEISEFSTSLIHANSKVPFKLILKNPNRSFVSFQGTINIYDIFGKLVKQIQIPMQTILSNSHRNFKDSSMREILLDEPLLLGLFRADLHLESDLRDQNQKDNKIYHSLYFIVIPTKIWVIITASIFILISIYLRVRKSLDK